jgi:hypothetical protein
VGGYGVLVERVGVCRTTKKRDVFGVGLSNQRYRGIGKPEITVKF